MKLHMEKLAIVVISSLSPVAAQEQTQPGSEPSDLATQLLAVPLAAEAEGYVYWDNIPTFVHPQAERQQLPSANSSLSALAQYWRRRFAQDPDRLSDDLRERLLDACEAYPDSAADLVHLVPRTAEANRRLLPLLDRLPNDGDSFQARGQIVRYLSQNSGLFRTELVARARAAHEGQGFIEDEEDVRALARLDWDRAAPLLTGMIKVDAPRMTALAVALQYQHFLSPFKPEAQRLRRRLKDMAENRSLPAKARDLAVEAVMGSEWSDRDRWFESLLADASLAEPSDGVFSFSPLEGPVHRDPSRWIPRLAALVSSPIPAVHLNASYILVSFQQDEIRPDAASPLLPWLFDPKWTVARDSGHSRHNLIYGLSRMRIPASQPGLLHVLTHPEEDDIFEIEYAAEAISQYHDEGTAPVLRRVLARESETGDRLAAAKALLASGGVGPEEKMRAVAAFARQVGTRAGREQLHRLEMADTLTIDADVVLGRAVIEIEGHQSTLTKAVREWSRNVRTYDPGTADCLDALLAVLPDPSRDAKLLAAIRDGSADASALLEAIGRRAWLQKSNPGGLTVLAKAKGAPAAIASVLLADGERQNEILSSDDRSAQRTLLALLRLSGDMAPEKLVERLVESPDPALAHAAREYWGILSRMRHSL